MYIDLFKTTEQNTSDLEKAIGLRRRMEKLLFEKERSAISDHFQNSMMANRIILTDCVNHFA